MKDEGDEISHARAPQERAMREWECRFRRPRTGDSTIITESRLHFSKRAEYRVKDWRQAEERRERRKRKLARGSPLEIRGSPLEVRLPGRRLQKGSPGAVVYYLLLYKSANSALEKKLFSIVIV